MTANKNKNFFLVVMCNKSILALKAFALHALREAEVFYFNFSLSFPFEILVNFNLTGCKDKNKY